MPRRQRSATLLAGFVVLLLALVFYTGFANPLLGKITRGLDLAGGVHIVLEAVERPQNPVTPEAMQTAMEVIRGRVDNLGVAEPTLQLWGDDRIVVDLPEASPAEAREIIGKTALLEFKDPAGEIIVTGAQLLQAQASFNPTNNRPVVQLRFDAEGAKRLEEATSRLSRPPQQPLAMFLDGELIMDPPPTVRSTIPNGEAIIEGLVDIDEAQRIAVLLSSGALPVELNIIEERVVSALLGEQSVAHSLRAGLLAVLAVIIFMLAMYRLPGLMSVLSLLCYMLIVVATLVGIKATLTLPGIAGIILSLGMAVDANVIIFERIREELGLGKSLRLAVESGFQNAFRAILDANVTTLIAAGALVYWGTGPVRGFAVTLTVGVLASMVSAILITRFLLRTLADTGWMRNVPLLFGIGEVSPQ